MHFSKYYNPCMGVEADVIREVPTMDGTVFILHDAPNNLDNPALHDRLRGFGFDPDLFKRLITLDYDKWIGEPEIVPGYPPENPVESLVIRLAETEDGKRMEVTETTANAPHTMKTRLNKSGSIGFEALLVSKGSTTYDISDEVVLAGELYAESAKKTSVDLVAGDLLIVPRPVGRQVAKVEPGTEYVYIGDPWDRNDPPVDLI